MPQKDVANFRVNDAIFESVDIIIVKLELVVYTLKPNKNNSRTGHHKSVRSSSK